MVLTQVLDDAEDEPCVLVRGAPSHRLQWDYLAWQDREETDWQTSPVRTRTHGPPRDFSERVQRAIPQLRATSHVLVLERVPFLRIIPSDDGAPSEGDCQALHAAFAESKPTATNAPHTEDVTRLAFGTFIARGAALHLGYVAIDAEGAEVIWSLGANRLTREVWLGPSLQPLRDECDPIDPAIEAALSP